jgi:hypothetical protein
VDLKGGESESETQSFQFSLNREAEDFDTLYALLQDADTQDKLEKLRNDSRLQQGKRKVQAEDKQTGEVKAKVGIGSVSASLGVSSRNDSDALITEEGEDLSGIFSGDDKGSFKVGVLGQKANVDWGTDADVDIDASGNRSADFSDEVKVGGLFKFLEKMANKLQGYKVSEADFKVIDQRASDTEKWGWCVPESDSLHKHWVKLGKQLVSPPTNWDWYEKEWESLDPKALRKLLAMAVVSDFMAKHGGDGGHEAWIRMLREWGVDPSGQQHGDAEDLGDAYEWQAEIKKEKALLAKCQKRVKMLPGILKKAVAAGKPDGARKKIKGLLKDLEKVRNGLEGFEDFDDKRAQAEMLARVDALVDRVEDLEESHLSSDGAPAGGKRARGRVKRALKRLKSSKKQERALLKKLDKFGQWEDREKDQMKVRREGPLARPKVALEYRDKIANLFEHWVDEIEALRALYVEAGVPPEEWEISAQGSGQRDASHEPDVDGFLRLARTAEKKIPRSKPIEKRLAFLRRL